MTQEFASASQVATDGNASSAHAHPVHSLDVDVRFETPAQAKQRRRRTSPRDYAILEAAYLRNSKPDKHDRARLVQQVNLGEKEVQIWFQNRRQNDRRKSKPLLPHELIPHFRNGIPAEAALQLDSPESSQESSPGREANGRVLEEEAVQNHRPVVTVEPSPLDTAQAHSMANITVDGSPNASVEATTKTVEVQEPVKIIQSSCTGAEERSVNAPSLERPSFTRKRSHEEMDLASVPVPTNAPLLTNAGAKEPLRRSSSMRLSMTAEGAVKVRLNNEPTPSPPKKRPILAHPTTKKASSFTRSRSAIEGDVSFQDAPTVARQALGRSRDARTWEFFCDRDARDALAMRAEEDGSGSAVGAINLMRSGSQKKVQPLSPNPAKQNFRRSGHAPGSKPSLTRSHSSLPRLQGIEKHASKHEREVKKHRRAGSGNDSDKENWLPGTREAVHFSTRNGVHGVSGNHSETSPSSGLTVQTPAKDSEDMISRKDKAKGDDLDCIQGLLSLSQGAWR